MEPTGLEVEAGPSWSPHVLRYRSFDPALQRGLRLETQHGGWDGASETTRQTPQLAPQEAKKAQARKQGLSLNPPALLCIG